MTWFSRVWLKAAPAMDARGGREHRERLVAGLSGTVVEVGCGAGLTFDLYPPAVTRVVALEPDALLREEAERVAGAAGPGGGRGAPANHAASVQPAANRAPSVPDSVRDGAPLPPTVPVDARFDVRDGVAEALPLGDGEADAVVFALVLCTVPEQAAALAEARRVLRPGGELRFWEHVIAERGPRRALLRAADSSGVWPALAGGCHPARDTLRAIEAAGFTVEELDAFDFRPSPLPPALPFIRGRARA